MSAPTYCQRYRPLTNRELIYLGSHLINSGTTFNALDAFHTRFVEKCRPNNDPWIIPLPGDSNEYYVIGTHPEHMVLVPEQLILYKE